MTHDRLFRGMRGGTLRMVVARAGAPLAALLVAGALCGCAAEMAYRDGKALIAEGKLEEGVAKLREASAQRPADAQFRMTYLQSRDRAAGYAVAEGDRMAESQKWREAEQQYRRALAVSPEYEPARSRLHTIETRRRNERLLDDALAARKSNDAEAARSMVGRVLAEEPANERALAMKRELSEPAPAAAGAAALSAEYRKPITIEFKDVSIKQLFEVISRSSGLNFIFDRDVKTDQKTSIFLKNSTVAAAIQFTLMTNQLEQQVVDANTILIYPNTVMKQREYQEMLVKSFFLSNAEAKTVANTLKTILKTRDVVVDEKLNMIIVRDSPSAIRLAEKLVALHDMPEPEVMLEVEVLEVSKSRLQDLGVQWPQSLTLAPLSSSGGEITLKDLRNLNSGTISASLPPFVIRAGVTDADARILANPRIRARNHEKAKILIGERVPNITTTATSTGFVSESVNYVDVGLKLEVEPSVHLDSDVAIKVSLEVSNIINQLQTKSGSVAYQIGTRTASTVLRLKDGENQVLAGLINDEDRRSGNRLPGIGELPLVGRLFGVGSDNRQKSEIVLSITPHLIRKIERPEASASEFGSGTDTSLRMRYDPGAVSGPSAAPTPAPPPVPSVAPTSQATDGGVGLKTAAADQPRSEAAAGAPPQVDIGTSPNAPAGALPAAAAVVLRGPAQVRVGDTFAVQLAVQSALPLTSIPAAVAFDNRYLQAVGVQEGTFLAQGGAQSAFTSKIDPSGQVLMTGTRTNKGGATDSAVFAVVSFRATAPAPAANIQLAMIAPVALGGQTMAANIVPLLQAVQIVQ